MTTATQTVREIVQKQPSSIGVFEEYDIEFCCGGDKPLAEACAAKDVDVESVIVALEAAAYRNENVQAYDWAEESLEALTAYIVAKHHAFCKRELPRLAGLAAKVFNQHGGTNPELALIRSKFAQLAEELTEHLAEEEVLVFPMIVSLEHNNRTIDHEGGLSPTSIGDPVSALIRDHDHAGTLLAGIRSLSRDFTVPDNACSSLQTFYTGLRDFEQDLHRHVHLENNILFPRAIELEAAS